MLAGFYGYIFGAEDSTDSEISYEVGSSNGTTSEASTMKTDKAVCGDEEDWFMVDDENARDQFAPELVPRYEMRDIDELSFASTRQTAADNVAHPTRDELRKAEELRLAKAKNAQRAHLEKMLFENVNMTSSGTFATSSSSSSSTATKVLKRDTASNKAKSRSKKSSGKLASGRNNDRKVNNID